ncbi:hypothetical protein LCGC14_1515270 [marine sediment metagenome]|uniref:Uncharacterized protein n=1 Tax=marine sediment metagenome TaxID=412755 RepID=A0A0F9JKY7_9ZZZZ
MLINKKTGKSLNLLNLKDTISVGGVGGDGDVICHSCLLTS